MKQLWILGLMLMASCFRPVERSSSTVRASAVPPGSDFKVVGYFPTWSGDVESIPYHRLTHINYSFLLPTPDGRLSALEDPERLTQLVQRAHASKVKVLIAIGGWNDGDDSAFVQLAANAAYRQAFVDNVLQFVTTWQLDGVEIDWEYPDGNEVPGFQALMKALSVRLHAKGKLLSAAVTASDFPGSTDPGIISAVDYLNIMVYDLDAPHSSLAAAEKAIVHWKRTEGLNRDKLILGVPFYSRAKGYVAYKDIISKYGASAAASDTANDGLDYNGQPTMRAKTKLARQEAGGVMIWEISQDTADETSLLKTIADEISQPSAIWRQANLTNFTSYPDPGSEECLKYNGCAWAGMFAALPDKQSQSWVKATNIAAVHSADFPQYKLKTLRLRHKSAQIDVKVYDMCADSDCNGCCSENRRPTGFLIDLESYTAQRFGLGDGAIEWTCLDCTK
ncbi:MAG TPA: glycosyl hydrolase family 18 protein [Oligoflexus sp.]|uniref:glycosyl hydrolase family 18 protein n=1 Tax=Oligoflexus sp. TaxID=1971216 RepID=UPI002D3491A1|nr:glycosyl hydrolase family 18 protein [Oligoflexus sp.]HYX38142.1 glycosyl hydrolase family 18 protein [Oligoflexus sp.]